MASPSGLTWEDPFWQDRRKHVPPPRTSAADVAIMTEGGRPALYHPNYRSATERERLEMACLQGEPLPSRAAVRCYYVKHDVVIGYSEGEPTQYVYAEWVNSGAVHGRPITIAELKKKGGDL